MKQYDKKKLAKLVKIREHRARIGNWQLEKELRKARKINQDLRKKRSEAKRKADNFYAGIEERFLKTSETFGTSAAFSTFAMAVHAAREDLVISEQALEVLQQELDQMRGQIVRLKEAARTSSVQLKKAEENYEIAKRLHSAAVERKESNEIEESAILSHLRSASEA